MSQNIILEDRDIIRVYPSNMFIKKNNVTIQGVVVNEGSYDLKENMTLKDLIFEAGGLIYKDEMLPGLMFSVDISRRESSLVSNSNVYKNIRVNIDQNYNVFNSSNFSSRKSKSVILKDNDFIIIRRDNEINNRQSVNIQGFIKYPGDYIIDSGSELSLIHI